MVIKGEIGRSLVTDTGSRQIDTMSTRGSEIVKTIRSLHEGASNWRPAAGINSCTAHARPRANERSVAWHGSGHDEQKRPTVCKLLLHAAQCGRRSASVAVPATE